MQANEAGPDALAQEGDTTIGGAMLVAAAELTALLSLREELSHQLQLSHLALQAAEGELAQLERQLRAAQARLEEDQRRACIEAAGFGAELGSTVAAAQRAMTRAERPDSSYAIAELTMRLEANMQVDRTGALELRLPGVNEQMVQGTFGSLTISITPQRK